MSGYTIGEIAVWLMATAVLAFALGWASRELVLRSGRPDVDDVAATTTTARGVEPAPEPEPEPVAEVVPPAAEAGPHPGSVLPLAGGGAPSPEYVVKVSRGSKIFHAPSSPAYARTTAAMWFVDEQAAEAAGFRRPKNG